MKFEIGNRVKIEGDMRLKDLPPEENNFLIIGKDRNFFLILLKPSSFKFEYGCILNQVDLEDWKADKKYLGYNALCLALSVLKHPGKVCNSCQAYFDFLSPEDSFHCWKCEL